MEYSFLNRVDKNDKKFTLDFELFKYQVNIRNRKIEVFSTKTKAHTLFGYKRSCTCEINLTVRLIVGFVFSNPSRGVHLLCFCCVMLEQGGL